MNPASWRDKIERPIFLVSPPRSGSTLLFQTLCRSPSLVSIGGESHGLMEGMPALHPATHGWHSNRLTAADAAGEVVEELSRRFVTAARDRQHATAAPGQRLLEKTPKNSLRLPFLAEAYPDAVFVYLYRDARPTLASMMEAWRSGRFRTYPRLPGWTGLPWSLLLVPGWRALNGQPLPEIVAEQWRATSAILLDDLQTLSPERVLAVAYDDFVGNPQSTVVALCGALGIGWDTTLPVALPWSATTVSPPKAGKWLASEAEIAAVWDSVAATDEAARQFCAERKVGLG